MKKEANTNSGDYNSGYYNSGDYNSGYFNSCNNSSGAFNTKKEITEEILVVNNKTILDRFNKNNKEVQQVLDLLGHYKNKFKKLEYPDSFRGSLDDLTLMF